MRPLFSPIPGAGPPVRGLFVDRWGTLLELPDGGYETRMDRVVFTPGAIDALFRAGQAGWHIYILGNEPAVAFGELQKERWEGFEEELNEHLRSHGVIVERCYTCTDHPEGIVPHNKDSVFLLPNTGAMYHAAQVDGIDLAKSWVIGDSTLELVAGWRAGCHLAGVRTGLAVSDGTLHVETEVTAANLASVIHGITSGLISTRS